MRNRSHDCWVSTTKKALQCHHTLSFVRGRGLGMRLSHLWSCCSTISDYQEPCSDREWEIVRDIATYGQLSRGGGGAPYRQRQELLLCNYWFSLILTVCITHSLWMSDGNGTQSRRQWYNNTVLVFTHWQTPPTHWQTPPTHTSVSLNSRAPGQFTAAWACIIIIGPYVHVASVVARN